MDLSSCRVGFMPCQEYGLTELSVAVDKLCRSLSFSVKTGDRVLLKPNLVASKGHAGLAVTNPVFIEAVAMWFVDHGAFVSVGDSPAFGRGVDVMKACGIAQSLAPLPVKLIDFTQKRKVTTKHGYPVVIADEVFECDHLVSLPKLKAHGQMRLTMAVKNFFGVVLGWRKAYSHMYYGGNNNAFVALLIDLLHLLPDGISLMDGVAAMHKDGPIDGEPFATCFVGASKNPLSLDRATMEIIDVLPQTVPLWCEANRRGLKGCDFSSLEFPLLSPEPLKVSGFIVPEILSPVRFQFQQFFSSCLKRVLTKGKQS